ncbi:hypothetical protein R1sor_005990 [Riccia sorocarpa]|uniref:Uncharacterized protein n=1 Tax=Riccia sorocarpa TaxID=122646 RepID=A0ABD3HPT8_9MARC
MLLAAVRSEECANRNKARFKRVLEITEAEKSYPELNQDVPLTGENWNEIPVDKQEEEPKRKNAGVPKQGEKVLSKNPYAALETEEEEEDQDDAEPLTEGDKQLNTPQGTQGEGTLGSTRAVADTDQSDQLADNMEVAIEKRKRDQEEAAYLKQRAKETSTANDRGRGSGNTGGTVNPQEKSSPNGGAQKTGGGRSQRHFNKTSR